MPYKTGERLPGEYASRLGHLEVLNSPLVKSLCKSFEEPSVQHKLSGATWSSIAQTEEPLPLVFGVDGSLQVIESETHPKKALGFVKTALVMLDRPALDQLDKYEPHPLAVRDILETSQVYHATVFPLRYVYVPGMNVYDSVRQIIFDSFRDPSLEGQVYDTFKWLAYEKWDGKKKSLPQFQCPHCESGLATLPYDADRGPCPNCNEELLATDMLGFHQAMTDDAAPDNIASDYMGIHETLLLFTGIRYYWETKRSVLSKCLFIKDGPLSIRAQYSKLVNPIRRFLSVARDDGCEVRIVGQEKSGAFWEHLQIIADAAPANSMFIPDHKYIREEIQHRKATGAMYGKDTNYGAKVFVKLNERCKYILNIPNGSSSNPQATNLIGATSIITTIAKIPSARHEDALLPIELAHSVASLSTYPSAKVLSLFAEAATK